MNTYLVKFDGISYVGLPHKTTHASQIQAWSEEEAREKILQSRWYSVMSEIEVELVSYYSEKDHDELELRMERGV